MQGGEAGVADKALSDNPPAGRPQLILSGAGNTKEKPVQETLPSIAGDARKQKRLGVEIPMSACAHAR